MTDPTRILNALRASQTLLVNLKHKLPPEELPRWEVVVQENQDATLEFMGVTLEEAIEQGKTENILKRLRSNTP